MTPQESEFIAYLQSCKLPELQQGKVTKQDQPELAEEMQRLFSIIENQNTIIATRDGTIKIIQKKNQYVRTR